MTSHKGSHLADKRQRFIFTSKLGKYYLKLRKKSLNLGLSKSTVIPYVLKYIDEFSSNPNHVIQIIDFGCSEGHMMNEIHQMSHKEICLTGIDFNESIVKSAARNYTYMDFYHKDIFKDSFHEFNQTFDIALSINMLHEIYSFYGANGHFDHKRGKQSVISSIKTISKTLKPGGVLIIFDGIESDKYENDVKVRFKNKKVEDNFLKFTKEYTPYTPEYSQIDELTYQIDSRGFTKFITKYRFFDSLVWEMEREETYQYFTEAEFNDAFKELGFTLESVSFISPNVGTWGQNVTLLDKSAKFPVEHVMFIVKKNK